MKGSAPLRSTMKARFPGMRRIVTRIKKPTAPIPLGLWLLNLIVQRVFRVNSKVPWMVHYTSKVSFPDRIKLGKKVWVSFAISGACHIQARNGLSIGDCTIFAPGIKIISANHDPENLDRWLESDSIDIGAHCWIGASAIILPGVKLGDRCIVGAGAVVTKSFPSDSVVVGVPAKRIR
jgi:acetyltransferase-like isoleucine patch superfamily enzyme